MVYIGKVVLHVVTLPALFPLKGTVPWPGSRSRNRWLVGDPLRCRIPRRKSPHDGEAKHWAKWWVYEGF